MNYLGISIAEVVDNINKKWYLPAIQRPYVWGNRYEAEQHICCLFDSIVRRYPIGSIIVWETTNHIPYRPFMFEYKEHCHEDNVNEDLWSNNKYLVYDGQQRLQTIYSCLKAKFNDRWLVFNCDTDVKDINDNGFRFVCDPDNLGPTEVLMNTVYEIDAKSDLRGILRERLGCVELPSVIEDNIDLLWLIFHESTVKSLACFTIDTANEDEVNTVFRRLNTGGVPLSKADLLFSKIKDCHPEIENDILSFCEDIYDKLGLGFTQYDILSILHLLVKGRVRIDDQKATDDDIAQISACWKNLKNPISDFFTFYLQNHLHISNMEIIPHSFPVYVLICYYFSLYQHGYNYKDITEDDLRGIDKFFILSELLDWGLQSYADNFAKIILSKRDKAFPIEELYQFVESTGKRPVNLQASNFEASVWFSLKILMPQRHLTFDNKKGRRLSPEIDHIFPVHLKGGSSSEKYQDHVNVVWNMQPVIGEINLLKRNFHPLDFFTNKVKRNGEYIDGKSYYPDYDYMPSLDSDIWSNPDIFVEWRKNKMQQFLSSKYGLQLQLLPSEIIDKAFAITDILVSNNKSLSYCDTLKRVAYYLDKNEINDSTPQESVVKIISNDVINGYKPI